MSIVAQKMFGNLFVSFFLQNHPSWCVSIGTISGRCVVSGATGGGTGGGTGGVSTGGTDSKLCDAIGTSGTSFADLSLEPKNLSNVMGILRLPTPMSRLSPGNSRPYLGNTSSTAQGGGGSFKIGKL